MYILFNAASATNTNATAAEVVQRYKSLADIERGFRVLKSDIEIGAVYLRLPKRIRAHALIYFMALFLYRVMRMRLKAAMYTNPYAIIGLFVMFTYIMFRRYVGAKAEIERANAHLAQRLESRELELGQSYARLREIEHLQTLSDERMRLTQDMHDGLGASLVSALRVVQTGRMSDTELGEILKSCIDDLKLTIDSMEPVDDDLLLLLATLRFRLGPRLTSAGISLLWEVVDLPALTWLDPRNALHILRILQESFANILKHTQAREIRVSTERDDCGVTVTISDNGQGFSLDAALQKGGKGLHNQQRRAQSVGGTVRWQSDASGTRMMLWLPEKNQGSPAAQSH